MLARALCLTALALLMASAVQAQTYIDSLGTIVPGVVPLPYSYTPLSPGQHNLAITSATKLTIPTGARYATICAGGAYVHYTTDGTTVPTSSVGQPLSSGACVSLSGPKVLANFSAISATGTLDVEYFQ